MADSPKEETSKGVAQKLHESFGRQVDYIEVNTKRSLTQTLLQCQTLLRESKTLSSRQKYQFVYYLRNKLSPEEHSQYSHYKDNFFYQNKVATFSGLMTAFFSPIFFVRRYVKYSKFKQIVIRVGIFYLTHNIMMYEIYQKVDTFNDMVIDKYYSTLLDTDFGDL